MADVIFRKARNRATLPENGIGARWKRYEVSV